MLYIDLINDTEVSMTAEQLKLAVQEATLLSREQALQEAVELIESADEPRYAVAQLRKAADAAAISREDVARQGLATRGLGFVR